MLAINWSARVHWYAMMKVVISQQRMQILKMNHHSIITAHETQQV